MFLSQVYVAATSEHNFTMFLGLLSVTYCGGWCGLEHSHGSP